MAVESEDIPKKVKKHRKNKNKVIFETELVSKDRANEILSQVSEQQFEVKNKNKKKSKKEVSNKKGNLESSKESNGINEYLNNAEEQKPNHRSKKKRKAKDSLTISEDLCSINDSEEAVNNKTRRKWKESNYNKEKEEPMQNNKTKKKRKVSNPNIDTKGTSKDIQNNQNADSETSTVEEGEHEGTNSSEKTVESNRAKKRKKHLELLEAKKQKVSLVTQQNVLNYLSKWKHSREDWKFEKLKQIWLTENLFDSAKIPDTFWDTTVEYFTNAKGFIRKLVLRDALAIIEKDPPEEENEKREYDIKIKRARDIVQCLQE